MRRVQMCFPQPRTAVSVASFQTTFWHDIKHSEMSTLIEDGSAAVDNLISIFSSLPKTLHEMLRCHVTVFTVCWQKCNFPPKAYLSYPARAGTEIIGLISDKQGVCDVFGGFVQNDVWIFVFICPGDKLQVLWYRWCPPRSLCHDQVQLGVSYVSKCCIACKTTLVSNFFKYSFHFFCIITRWAFWCCNVRKKSLTNN